MNTEADAEACAGRRIPPKSVAARPHLTGDVWWRESSVVAPCRGDRTSRVMFGEGVSSVATLCRGGRSAERSYLASVCYAQKNRREAVTLHIALHWRNAYVGRGIQGQDNAGRCCFCRDIPTSTCPQICGRATRCRAALL